ncbi:hypothetical protein [Mycoplasma phocoeninasale]|uniref:hypothetical protein n=1 Tax=Mycoplasma phocoeninasale TaxID=2726117 RepID=UPI001967D147|nr:hypothetical protein [Mycoplasma phocoeninasale]MBN0970486.1 hypothetical protein [Mycoplasma phocoeninasale]
MKKNNYKWLIVLPLAITSFPLIAASCNNTMAKDGKKDKEKDKMITPNPQTPMVVEKDFEKINYPSDILYLNLMGIFSFKLFPSFLISSPKFSPSLDETKKIIGKLMRQEPQNKVALEEGIQFFTELFKDKDNANVQNLNFIELFNKYKQFQNLLMTKDFAKIQGFFIPKDLNAGKELTIFDYIDPIWKEVTKNKDIKYYSYLVLILPKLTMDIFSPLIEIAENSSAEDAKKIMTIIDKAFEDKSGLESKEIEEITNIVNQHSQN